MEKIFPPQQSQSIQIIEMARHQTKIPQAIIMEIARNIHDDDATTHRQNILDKK